MGARGSVNIDSPCASCDCGNSASNIHLDLPHPREIHYQPLTHRLLYMSRALTKGKQFWPTIRCTVENLGCRLVGSLTCDCDLALNYSAQVFCYRGPYFICCVRCDRCLSVPFLVLQLYRLQRIRHASACCIPGPHISRQLCRRSRLIPVAVRGDRSAKLWQHTAAYGLKTCPLYVCLDTMSLAKGATAETTASISACATLNDFNVPTRCMAARSKWCCPIVILACASFMPFPL
jgi:hypothetical protein